MGLRPHRARRPRSRGAAGLLAIVPAPKRRHSDLRPDRGGEDGRRDRARGAASRARARTRWRSRRTRSRSTAGSRSSPASRRPRSRSGSSTGSSRSCRSRRRSRRAASPRWRTRRSTRRSTPGRRPIVVGGTGLYLQAALTDLELRPPPPPGVRERILAEVDERGLAALHAELAERSPTAAAGVEPTDRTRVVRALELLEMGEEPAPAGEGSRLWTAELRRPTVLCRPDDGARAPLRADRRARGRDGRRRGGGGGAPRRRRRRVRRRRARRSGSRSCCAATWRR